MYWRLWKIVHYMHVGTAGDALCAEVAEVVLKVTEVLGGCAEGAWRLC